MGGLSSFSVWFFHWGRAASSSPECRPPTFYNQHITNYLYQSFRNMKLVKRPPKTRGQITPEEYVSRAIRIGTEARAAQDRYGKMLDALDNRYVIDRCPRHTGEVIALPEGAKPGFDSFTIETIRPHIQRSSDTAFTVGFRYFGTFTGPDGKTEKGELKIKAKQQTNETNEKPADA